ncbi:precorrin-3B C17-methyltransferase [Synechococcus sp. PCC 7502]|uniref:precorrin-3B C(17)-methyltransferase n=1 Tax=Synechococcus sp. PCC 7502 TaxID=1173263 RepID=UPI00029F8EFB|nr:precorrin-3B C(17)-methyltransferase [Synechococcus sp. PCC 7502]AFY72676.1 precorrin-3B C17-methyltransferase [Synechococcus sp. PCC 7502]
MKVSSSQPPAIIILSESNIAIARQIQNHLSGAVIYGLEHRTQSADVTYAKFSDLLQLLFSQGHPIIGICAAGILIRTLAPLLTSKRAEPPVIAIAEDGSVVVPLLGGLNGANDLARQIADGLSTKAAITTAGDLRFKTTLLSPPMGWRLANTDDQAKTFLADLLGGAQVRLIGHAPWLSNLPLSTIAQDASHTIEIIENLEQEPQPIPSSTYLIYKRIPSSGKVSIIGTGPGSNQWISAQVKAILQSATDFVGYKTYLNLVAEFTKNRQVHASDNRVELERAELALDLAAQGRSVVVVSSGDAGIYGMATAVFEVLDQVAKPEWQSIDIEVAPGISAMQAAAALVGAPLGHDFCVISLSDILKPWEILAQRISAAAQADFVIAVYNPVSQTRTWQLAKAKEILLQWRSPNTPVILGRNLGRAGQEIQVITLAELAPELADMRTVILVGSSKTRIVKWGDRVKVYTPRTYFD